MCYKTEIIKIVVIWHISAFISHCNVKEAYKSFACETLYNSNAMNWLNN